MLVNKWVSCRVLQRLGVTVPSTHLLALSSMHASLIDNTGYSTTLPHFGSEIPVDFDRETVFDFLPHTLLGQVANLWDVTTALIVDHWLGCTKPSRTVFCRDGTRSTDGGGENPKRPFRGYVIGSSFAFGGVSWEFAQGPSWKRGDNQLQCIDIEQSLRAVSCVDGLPAKSIKQTLEHVPTEWLLGRDRNLLSQLLDELVVRRGYVKRFMLERPWTRRRDFR